ncbi:MAG: MerR family transcriptional regulator [Pseudobdellovibrionaceae bacterium]|nr:MAG: MerR family transcriptional regulator [Pseudobdellovibrionaceae bacterium]
MDEVVFETKDERRYAPSAQTPVTTELAADADIQFERELQKIPDKMAFKIGEVARIVGVKPYVLRYWETEFEQLKPKKSKHNQRAYTRRDVEMVMTIKKLLYKDRFSIEGARTALKQQKKATHKAKVIRSTAEHLDHLRDVADHLIADIQKLKLLFQ